MSSHILGLGMGYDSAAMLTRFLLEPQIRTFDLDDLIVITAMTGDEYDRTEQLMNEHLLPLMRRHRVRYVQVAALGPRPRDGYTVLSDSRDTQKMTMRGPWRLSDELRANGTLPESARNRRKCSIHAKGQPLDGWVRDNLAGRPFHHMLGFAAEEATRAANDESYTRHSRTATHPLIQWAWDREACAGYLHEVYGVEWCRSCCTFCPFQAGADIGGLARRWSEHPDAPIEAIELETTALALNPRMMLFGRRTARQVAEALGMDWAAAAADAHLSRQPWAIYDIRRIYHQHPDDPHRKGQVWRSVRTVGADTQHRVLDWMRRRRGGEVDQRGFHRVWLRRPGTTFPGVEHALVAAPVGVLDKERPTFNDRWRWALAHMN